MSSGPNNSQARGKTHVFAVVRFEPDALTPEGAVTVKEILPTLEEAESEVTRLRKSARGKAMYFWQTTRWYASGRNAREDASHGRKRLRVLAGRAAGGARP